MQSFESESDPPAASWLTHTAYALGVALRHTVRVVVFPFQGIARRLGGGAAEDDRSFASADTAPRSERPAGRRWSWRPPSAAREARSRERVIRDPERTGGGAERLGHGAARTRSGAAWTERGAERAGGREEHRGGLARALRHPDPRMRIVALDTVGEFSPERAAATIIEALSDLDPDVRCAAAVAATRAQATTAVFSLILTLEDPVLAVRAAAWAALRELCDPPLAVDVEAAGAERQVQIETLKRWWKEQRLAQLAAAIGREPA